MPFKLLFLKLFNVDIDESANAIYNNEYYVELGLRPLCPSASPTYDSLQNCKEKRKLYSKMNINYIK